MLYYILYFNIHVESRVLQVERKSVSKPDQAEFVLSEGMLISVYYSTLIAFYNQQFYSCLNNLSLCLEKFEFYKYSLEYQHSYFDY